MLEHVQKKNQYGKYCRLKQMNFKMVNVSVNLSKQSRLVKYDSQTIWSGAVGNRT